MDCTKCKKYSTCTTLCKKAEKYVSQDHVSQREILLQPIQDRVKNDRRTARLNTPLELADLFEDVDLVQIASFFTEKKVDFPFLTPLQNKILHLFYFEGQSYAEIAMRVNIRVKAVDNQLVRARKKIKGFFSKNAKE
jgi:DNA-binding NarL/FixJ family response regulator